VKHGDQGHADQATSHAQEGVSHLDGAAMHAKEVH
jgi:hypothetical protein